MFTKIKNLFKKVKSNVLFKINSLIFTDEKIKELLLNSLVIHLDQAELDEGDHIEYDFLNAFSEEEKEEVEKQEKDSTNGNLMAVTSIYDEGEYEVLFALVPIKDFAFKFLPWKAKKEIEDLAKHEAFHVRQYKYICSHGGLNAIKRLAEYMAVTPYEDNIFEMGAYLYQWFDEVQDFKLDFEYFINPSVKENEEPVSIAAVVK